MNGLASLTYNDLAHWVQRAKTQITQGQIAQRIPLLAKTNPGWFAVHIHTQTGQSFSLGDIDRPFPLMSAIKPFQLLYLLEQVGLDTVFHWVGIQPSDAPFNSLEQLTLDGGRPRNPMINSGAITLSDKLPGKDGHDRCQRFCKWLNQQAGTCLTLDEIMLASVRSGSREPNQALVQLLAEAKQLNHPEMALDTYEQICCLSGQVTDLARLGMLLAIDRPSIAFQHRCAVNALMLTCGLYQASALYAVQIGLPMKSGISGALLAVVPRQGAIACYSPALDQVGNPIGGLALVEVLSQELKLSILG